MDCEPVALHDVAYPAGNCYPCLSQLIRFGALNCFVHTSKLTIKKTYTCSLWFMDKRTLLLDGSCLKPHINQCFVIAAVEIRNIFGSSGCRYLQLRADGFTAAPITWRVFGQRGGTIRTHRGLGKYFIYISHLIYYTASGALYSAFRSVQDGCLGFDESKVISAHHWVETSSL